MKKLFIFILVVFLHQFAVNAQINKLKSVNRSDNTTSANIAKKNNSQLVFIKFENINGGSVENNYQNWSDLISCKLYVNKDRKNNIPTGRSLYSIDLWKKLDNSSLTLMEKCFSNITINKAIIEYTEEINNKRVVVLKYELEKVFLKSFSIENETKINSAFEEISLYVDAIKVTYNTYTNQGVLLTSKTSILENNTI